MKKLILIIAVLGICIVSLAQPEQLNQLKTEQTRSLIDIDEFILEEMESLHKPGLSACIIKGDSIVWRGNYGYADVDNNLPVTDSILFNAYSIGKSITAASIMKLWEDDLVGLDENINGFLPFQIDNPYVTFDNITPRMLMTHTSSIVDFNLYNYVTIGDAPMTLSYFLENYLSSGGTFYSNSNFSTYTPGTHYTYSNFGSALNGFLAEALMDTLFKDYVKDSLLIPLQMENSAWFLDEIDTNDYAKGYQYQGNQYVAYPNYGHPAYPGMTLKSSSEELAHFNIMLMNGGLYLNNQILDETTVDTMCSVHFSAMLTKVGLGLYRRGLQCANEDKTIWGHQGGGTNGYASEIQFCPDENIGVVYMSNSEDYAHGVLKRLFEYGALIVVPDTATNLGETSFTASWQVAPDAFEYYFDLAYDWQFVNYVEGYENLNIGLDTAIDVIGLSPNTPYYYRITAHNGIELGPTSTMVVTTTLIEGVDEKKVVNDFMLSPNPAQNTIHISLQSTNHGMATISIYNQLGQKLKTIELGELTIGTNEFTSNISVLENGIYFLQLQVDKSLITKKFVKR